MSTVLHCSQVSSLSGRNAAGALASIAKLKINLTHPILLGSLLYHVQLPKILSSLNPMDINDVFTAASLSDAKLQAQALRSMCVSLKTRSNDLPPQTACKVIWACAKLHFFPGRDVLDALTKV